MQGESRASFLQTQVFSPSFKERLDLYLYYCYLRIFTGNQHFLRLLYHTTQRPA